MPTHTHTNIHIYVHLEEEGGIVEAVGIAPPPHIHTYIYVDLEEEGGVVEAVGIARRSRPVQVKEGLSDVGEGERGREGERETC